MTALAGLWRFDGRPDAAEGCERMLASQRIYGPHTGAQWADHSVALGRRLIRVLPEDAYDCQPLVGGGGRYVLVADVRLDNRAELTEALRISTPEARNLCDASIVLAAIERWDDAFIEHMIGDYAFALWDAVRRRLLLGRDPLGQRPLHYHRGKDFFAFASMPKGLHALAEIPCVPDEEKIADFLILMPETGTKSFFYGIEKVEAGHVSAVTANGLTTRLHWQPSRRQIVLPRSEDYSDALRELLDQAVRCRLRGARDVGAHLSGGLDSSAVAATAARLLAPTNRQVFAFTAVPREGYDGPAPRNRFVDEGPHAAATAALYPNMEHVLIRDSGRSPLDDLDRSFFLFEAPVLNICASWWYSIYDSARERKLKIVLSGDSGNMGLSYAGTELLPELLRTGRWFRLWQEARSLVAPERMRWRGVLANTFGPWCPAALWGWLNRIAHGNTPDVFDWSAINPRRLAELDLPARAKAHDWDLASRPWKDGFAARLWGIRWADRGNSNKGLIGGWHIDERDPTADVRLLEFCLAVPTEQFLGDGVQRRLARRALSDRLPKLVLEDTRRGLQAADWHERLTEVRDRVAVELGRLDSTPLVPTLLDLPRLRRLAENWPAGGWESPEIGASYRSALLRGISAGHFLRRARGTNSCS
jgi:asparagine synthase (glutamine-hydrolysing)